MISLTLSLLALGASASASTSTNTSCPRALLEQLSHTFLAAQESGNPTLLPLSPNATITENDTPLPLSSSTLTIPIPIDLSRTIHDEPQCQTFTQLTSATSPHPYVLDTRLTIDPASQTITDVLSVVSDPGDWLFNATSHLYYASRESWTPIPAGERTPRAALLAAAIAYLDSWSIPNVTVPYGTPCARLEGGAYTGTRNESANSCFMPLFPPEFSGIKNRRFVVDEVLGGVAAFVDFPFLDLGKPEGTSSLNLFRVEADGRIRWIHESTVCSVKNCGR